MNEFMQPRMPRYQYVPGRWYHLIGGTPAAGAALASGSIKLVPFELRAPIAIDRLGVRITTLAAAGNIQLAIYGMDPTTGKPTGSELLKTGSITTAAAANVNGTPTTTILLPGFYYAAVNADNATVVLQANNAAWNNAALIGGSTQDIISSAAAVGLVHYSTPVTFNTWGNLTAATFTEATTAAYAMMQVRAA